MSPDRIAELRRQRALVAQHLAWIDAELIAAGSGQAPSARHPAALADEGLLAGIDPDGAAGAGASETAPEDPALLLANSRADEIIERYRATEAIDPKAAKRGCLVLLGAALVLGGAALLAIYYFGYVR
jgi:hypothetical protein